MTLTDQRQGSAGGQGQLEGDQTGFEQRLRPSQRWEQQPQEERRVNVGDTERAVSIAAGAIIGLLGLGRRSIPGLITAAVGGGMIYRGVTGYCALSDRLGIDTAHGQGQGSTREEIGERGIQIEQALQINRSPEELYQFWRNFENLPRIMSYLESVRQTDGRKSHWVAKAPSIAGGKVEWDAEITRDEPNSRIAWRSLPGSDIDTAGEIRFGKAMGDRGTDVHVFMSYVPPAGKLGHWIASILGENPRRVVREDLRNFKRVMEIGEVLTIIGQPHGTCTGQGKRYTESDRKPLYR